MITQEQKRRNEPCQCGSGKKYKKCCEKAQQSSAGLRDGAEIEGQFRIAGNLYRDGHNARAAEVCGRILAGNPSHVGALCLLGRAQLNSGHSRKATQLFKAALQVSPRDIQALYFPSPWLKPPALAGDLDFRYLDPCAFNVVRVDDFSRLHHVALTHPLQRVVV